MDGTWGDPNGIPLPYRPIFTCNHHDPFAFEDIIDLLIGIGVGFNPLARLQDTLGKKQHPLKLAAVK
jgi:hypothetical protein